MLRVPGSDCDLLQVRARGGDVRVVYSPLDALELAIRNPDKQVVFFAVGFETTAPANAMAVWRARELGRAQLQHAGLPRDRAARDDGHPRRAGQPGAGVPRRRPRVHRHGMDRVRADRGPLPGADRGDRLRAARHPRGDLPRGPAAGGGPPRGGEPVRARGAAGGHGAGEEPRRARCSIWWTASGGASARSRRVGWGSGRSLPTSTPSIASSLRSLQVKEPTECRAGDVLRGRLKPHQCPAFGTPLHARAPARRADGLVRRRLRGVLQLRPVPAAASRWRSDMTGRFSPAVP